MYQETSVEPARVRAWGSQAALEIRSPRNGVLRLRHAPSSLLASLRHPELGPKRSFAVVRDDEVHNAYGLGMAQATFEACRRFVPERRPFILTRAGYAGIQRYAAMWTGDNSSHWGHLELSIPMLLGLGLSGVPFVGVDVPGFLGRPSGELMVRWSQAATFYPLWRNHSVKGSPPKEPWRFGEPYLSLAKAALQRRYRLLPALYTLMAEASQTGQPPLRALALSFPDEPESISAFDQMLFGPDSSSRPSSVPGRRGAWPGSRGAAGWSCPSSAPAGRAWREAGTSSPRPRSSASPCGCAREGCSPWIRTGCGSTCGSERPPVVGITAPAGAWRRIRRLSS